jgi:hypothetical protein
MNNSTHLIEQELLASYDHSIKLYGWHKDDLTVLINKGYALRFNDGDEYYPVLIFEPDYVRPDYGIHTIGRPWYAS